MRVTNFHDDRHEIFLEFIVVFIKLIRCEFKLERQFYNVRHEPTNLGQVLFGGSVGGVMKAFGLKPDMVSGIATNTTAGIQLIENLCGVRAINIMDPEARPEMMKIIKQSFEGEKVLSKFT